MALTEFLVYCLLLHTLEIYILANSFPGQTARQALDYVAYVEKLDNCSLGTGESLDLLYDHSVWDLYALTAVRLANFISKIITSNNNSMSSLSDEVLFALVRNNVHLKSVIFGSGIPFEPHESLRYPLFCPYAFRDENKTVVLSKDLAVEYNYTDPKTEYYQVLRYKDFRNISMETDTVYFRSGDSLLPAVEILQPVADLADGHWTKPYFDCGGGNIWMVTYSSPIFALEQDKKSVIFRGVATIDIELTNIDINQCDVDRAVNLSGTFDIFRGTHLCEPSTECVFTSGHGFRRGSYICTCAKGYFFPDTSAKHKFFKGYDIEDDFTSGNITSTYQYRCTPCASGCDVCTDSSPCLFKRNIFIRTPFLILTIITIILILVASGFVFRLKESKIIKSGSPIFLLLMCAGGVLICLQMFVTFPEANDFLCMVSPWPYHLGFVLMFGALLLKTWRISIIFRVGQVRRVHLPDKTLLRRMAMMLATSSGYLIAWTAANDEHSEIRQTSSGLKFVMCSNNLWQYSSYGMEILVLLFGVYLCFTVRKAPASFNESRHISWALYNAIILSSFILLIKHFIAESGGPDLIYFLTFLNCQVIVTMTMVLIFVPKIHAVYMKVEVKRRNDLPAITGKLESYTVNAQYQSKSVQTTIGGEDLERIGY